MRIARQRWIEALDRPAGWKKKMHDALAFPFNAVDRPELCDASPRRWYNRGRVAIALGTAVPGRVLAKMLRKPHRPDCSRPQLGPLARLTAPFRGAAEKRCRRQCRRQFWGQILSRGAPARAVEAASLSQAHDAASICCFEGSGSGH